MNRIMMAALAGLAALAVTTLGPAAPPARAQGPEGPYWPAQADTAFDAYVRSMSDSTDAFFGLTAQEPDTAGLDSALAEGLAKPIDAKAPVRLQFALSPRLSFNRATGAVMGGQAGIGATRQLGRVTGWAEWANGPDFWMGGGRWVKRWGGDEDGASWKLDVSGARDYTAFDRDHFDRQFDALYAVVYGNDRNHYLRTDGLDVALSRTYAQRWATLAYRNQLESPLVTMATWNLFRRKPAVIENRAAALGRASEARLSAGARLPRVPVTVEAQWWGAGGPLGGDFEYSRARVAAGGAFPLGELFALLPQAHYGRVTGQALPQNAFYLGGGPGLRVAHGQSLQGTGAAGASLELLLQDDLLHALHLRQPPVFPIQASVFAGLGACWGYDPVTGLARLTDANFPESREWQPEVGASLLFRPGIPDPDQYIRFTWALPVGPGDRGMRAALSIGTSLSSLHRR